MKEIVYTCLRCGKQATARPDADRVPPEWAAIRYDRVHTVTHEDKPMLCQTSLDTHACDDCARVVLDVLEPQEAQQAAAL